jgi:hypothetical protein
VKPRFLNIICLLFLTTLLGCASAPTKATRKNWSLAAIESVVYAVPEVKKDWVVRSIEMTGPDTLSVMVGKGFGFLSGYGELITLRLQPDGSWKVEKVVHFVS